MGKADEADNSEDSDTTEGETNPEEEDTSDEVPDDNDTPVIDPAEDVEEDPVEEPTEEEVVDPAEEEVVEPTIEDSTNTVNDAETVLADLEAPEITLKQGDEELTSGSVPNRANNVSFEITAVDGVSFYYTVDDSEPTTSNENQKYTSAVTLEAPDQDGEETVTIKAIAHIPASGEGDDAVAEQTSAVTTATVVFRAKAKTISVMSGSDSATVAIGGQSIGEEAYEITATTSDIEVVVSADDKMFEVLYSVDGGTNTSALKKGQTANGSFADKHVSYGEGTYIIPKEVLTSDVQVVVKYLKEITLDWQGDAGWESVGATANVTRVSTDSAGQHVGIWGAQYSDTKAEKSNVLFAPQDTKVELEFEPVEGVEFTFTTVNYKKTGSNDMATDATISNDGTSASFEIANIGSDDYTVTVEGTSTTYSRTVVMDSENNEVPLTRNAGTIKPREEYTIQAFVTGGKGTYPIDSIEVKSGRDDAVEKGWVVLNEVTEKGDDNADVSTGIYTLKAAKGAAGKTLTVAVKGAGNTTLTTLSLKVAPVITKVTVTGAKNGVISQVIGTEASYALTLVAAEKTSEDVLAVKDFSGNAYIESAEIKGNKLVIKTKAVPAQADAAEITIINASDEGEEKTAVATVKVNTTAPAWADKVAPTVKLASATDVYLNLDMTLPKGADVKPTAGTTYYYKVTTTATNKKEGVDYIADGTARYYAVDGATVREKVDVINAKFGSGTDTKFNVDVQLVQYSSQSVTQPDPDQPGGDDSGDGDDGNEGDGGNEGGETGGGNEGGGETGGGNEGGGETGGGNEGGGENGGGNEGGGENGTNAASYTGASVNAAADETEGGEETPSTSNTVTPSGTLIASSKVVTVKNLATKVPYYADKITLKKEKAASGLYTGQTAAVATINFGKSATFIRDEDVEVAVLNAPKDKSGKDLLSASIKDSKVILDADSYLTPGKYTIQVTQTVNSGIPEGAVQASATLQVTVVQGIYDIDAASVPSIYVAANKAGTAKITPVYNDGDGDGLTDAKPKTAKVEYTVGKLNEDNQFVEDETIARKVTVKNNGTVTVPKGYEKDDIENNEFAVQVKAADFADNEVTGVAIFEIVTEAQELGDIVLVKQTEDGASYTKVSTDTAIPANQIIDGKANIWVLKKGITKADNFEYGDFVEPEYYTLSFSKKSDIGMDVYGDIWVKKPVDKVKVSAVTTDGGKKKATDLTLSVTYEEVGEVKLKLVGLGDVNFTDNKAEVSVPTGETIKVQAVEVDEEGTETALGTKLVDYKITAGAGAKIVQGAGTFNVGIVMSKKEATLKLTYPKGSTPKEVVYTITNNNFDLSAAPKVTVKKGEKLYASNTEAQDLTFTIAKANLADATKVKVSAATDAASQELYNAITTKEIALGEGGITTAAAVDFAVNFKANLDVIKKATLYFDFYGTESMEDGEEKDVLLTKTSSAVTVKTELLKKSFKLTNKYTMSAKDTAKVALTGKAIGVKDVEYSNILNANIKGTVNKFKEAFTLDEESGKLCLLDESKAKKDYQETEGSAKMNNLIGFVQYTVTYEDGSKEDFTTQLTITIKPSVRKLTATKVSVVMEVDMAPTITVMAGKTPCDLTYAAYADTEEKFIVDTTKGFENGAVTLKLADGVNVVTDLTSGKRTGTLTVIPSDSLYAAEWEEMNSGDSSDPDDGTDTDDGDIGNTDGDDESNDNIRAAAATEEQKAAFLAEHGIAVPVTIELKSIDTKNKVKVENKDKNVNMSSAEVNEDGEYTAQVPFTVLIQSVDFRVLTDQTVKNGVPVTPSWIRFSKVNGENAILVTIDKAVYATAVKEGGKTGEKYKLNGKAVKGTVLISSSKGGSADAVILTITPPTLSAADIENAADTPSEEEITVTVTPATATVEAGQMQAFTATVTIDGEEDSSATVEWTVAAKESGNLAGGTKFNANSNDANTLTVDENESVTSLVVTATYTKDDKTYTGTADVTVTPKSTTGGGDGDQGEGEGETE